jgi:hypothetical protein
MRGSREQFTLFLGGLEREDPEASAFNGKGHEGSVEPVTALAFPSSILCRVR